jgi:hypothetical protein
VSDDSKILTDLGVDDPVSLGARYRHDAHDRRSIDNQIRGVQQLLVDLLIKGVHATYARLAASSAAVVVGDNVCLASQGGATEPTVTKAVAAALTNAFGGAGVVLKAASPGGMVLIANAGMLSPSVTGLASGSPGHVIINTTTARCQRVASVGGSDYAVGKVDNTGWMLVNLK